MGECCGPNGYDRTFSGRFARRTARRYRRRGLTPSAEALAGFLADRGLEGATVLEIGGGVGQVQIELLRRGAERVVNLELATTYEAEAARLLEASGLGDRVERRLLDIAQAPDEVERADVVVLHRVVCCYPDYERLLTAAASKAGRLLVFSHPPANPLSRAVIGTENLVRRLQRDDFRAFVHPPDRMVAVLENAGLRPTFRWRRRAWCVVGVERVEARAGA